MAFRARRQNWYLNLKKAGFLPYEAYELSRFKDKSVVYFRAMVQERRQLMKGLLREAEAHGWSRTKTTEEWKALINFTYKEKKWVQAGHRLDVWKMLREYRDRVIDLGEYHPRRHKGNHIFSPITRIRLDKGNVDRQKRRYRERMKNRDR
jgi:hypothetical protein